MNKILESLEKRRIHLADRHIMFADIIEKQINNSGFAEVYARSDSLKACRENLKKAFRSDESKPDLLMLDISDSNGKMLDIKWEKKNDDERKEPSIFDDFAVVAAKYKIPEGNGLDFCKEIRSLYPKLKIVAYSGYTHWYPIRELEKLKIGHISKHSSIGELIIGIGVSLEGRIFHCEKSEYILEGNNPKFWFTPREKQLIPLVAEDYTSGEIAIILGLQQSTVDSMRKLLKQKTRAQFGHQNITKEAMLMGLIWASEVP